MPKKSGAANRKLKKQREAEKEQLANTWQKWLHAKKGDKINEKASCSSTVNTDVNTSTEEKQLIDNEDRYPLPNVAEAEEENLEIGEEELSSKSDYETVLFNPGDPSSWKRPYNYSLIATLVEVGPQQDEKYDYSITKDDEGRQERLKNISILSIEYPVTKLLDLDTIINDFASAKARKVKLM